MEQIILKAKKNYILFLLQTSSSQTESEKEKDVAVTLAKKKYFNSCLFFILLCHRNFISCYLNEKFLEAELLHNLLIYGHENLS